MRRMAFVVLLCFFMASVLPRTAAGQVITASGEGETTTTTTSSGDDGDSDNTLSFVLLGAVIAVLVGVAFAADRGDGGIAKEKESGPVGLYVKDSQARDALSSDDILTAGLAFNGEF
jgi:hypothetical protein